MRFTYFKFENFKGIESQILDIGRSPVSKVFALVGLNESGKTTILEAIDYFAHKSETLDALKVPGETEKDIYNLIPINKRDNFNGKISVEAGIELDDDDVNEIEKAFKKEGIHITEMSRKISYTQEYWFENSVHQKQRNRSLWNSSFKGLIGKSRKVVKLENQTAILASRIIIKRMPSILYFPNFLFEFPERIYLDPAIPDSKHKFYQIIIQDVLDSLDNATNIENHLTERILSIDEKDRRNLTSLLGKMQRQLTEVIFTKWNQIFNKEISKTEVVLFPGKDESGAYLEFNIKDDVDTYRIVERSLGFRWFFVYILLTQFRTYRKKHNNALFLFDEPASNLHPSAQTELLKSFEKLPKVIYTTHSHYLINPKWIENTFVIKNEAIDYDNEMTYHSKNTNIKIHKYREFAIKYPNQSNYFQPILEVLDYRPTNLEMVPKVVITEGKNDFFTYNYFQEVISRRDGVIKTIPGTSSSNMELLISLYLGWGADFCVLLDSDKEGLRQKARYIDLFGNTLQDLIVTYQDIDSEWVNTETEDLFLEEDKLKIQNRNYPSEEKFIKKFFNRSIQELYVEAIEIEISSATKNNLEKVLDFLAAKLGIHTTK